MSDELCYMSSSELLVAYANKDISPVEAVQATLDQINKYNEKFNAYCLVDSEQALLIAKQSEQRWYKGEPVGRIDGIPTSVKDLILTKGWPTLRGSKTTNKDQVSIEDAPCVARLREHGAVLIGKTTTPEFGWKGVTDSPLTGVTKNPWNTEHTPGGSSGGAAVAAACGMGVMHIGSDGGGSIRIPSSFCGLVGIKANFGRIPVYPASPFGTLSHVGPMTRSVQDTALMLTVMAGSDSRDAFSLPFEGRNYSDVIEGGAKNLRIAYSSNLGYAEVDEEVSKIVGNAVKSFGDLGVEVRHIDPGFNNPINVFRSHWYAGAAHILRGMSKEQRSLVDPGLQKVADIGERITMNDYINNGLIRSELSVSMRKFHEEFDILLTPTMPSSAFSLGKDSPIGADGEKWDKYCPFTYPFNLTGQPAATVPCGFTNDGLPVGLQIVGGQFDEVSVLRTARAFEKINSQYFGVPSLPSNNY